MSNPPSHSFSRSPVEEVYCRCTRQNTEPVSRKFLKPYPGWPPIRDEIRNMINEAGNISLISGCLLRYTDRFPSRYLVNLPEPVITQNMLSDIVIHQTSKENEELIINTSIPGTTGSVCSIRDDPKNPGWTLIFTIKSQQERFPSGETLLQWFDDARAEIHGLFDLIVPEEIVEQLR